MSASVAAIDPRPGWNARLALEFAAVGDRTVLLRKAHFGPLCAQKPFYPGDSSCHVYVLHPPGGLAGGDDLELRVRVAEDASALITMPASTKFYRTNARASRLFNRLEVAADAALEWLPPETILFGGSVADLGTEVHLNPRAAFLGWEPLALGRPRSGDNYASGSFEQRLSCYVGGYPVLLERTAAVAGDPLLRALWGFGGDPNAATLFAWPADESMLACVRERLAFVEGFQHGATVVDGWLVLRMTGPSLPRIREGLESVRTALHPGLFRKPAIRPRIWNT